MTVNAEDIAALCDAAYDLIDTEGWWDGKRPDLWARSDGLCLVQAIAVAAHETGHYRAKAATYQALEAATGAPNLIKWNDRQSEYKVLRKLEEVGDAYRGF